MTTEYLPAFLEVFDPAYREAGVLGARASLDPG